MENTEHTRPDHFERPVPILSLRGALAKLLVPSLWQSYADAVIDLEAERTRSENLVQRMREANDRASKWAAKASDAAVRCETYRRQIGQLKRHRKGVGK